MKLYKLFLSELFIITILLIITTLLSSCSLFNSEDDIVKSSTLPTVKNQFTPLIVWSSSVGKGIGDFYSNLSPAFANGKVYAADRKGIVCAFNADNGKKLWSVNLAEKNGWFSHISALLSGGVTVSGNRIYISSEKSQVYALSAVDGSIVWRTRVAGEALSCPVVSNGMVLIHTSNGKFQALNEINGDIKWTVDLSIPFLSIRGESTPTTSFGISIIGGDNGHVSAVMIQNGQLIWQQCISQITGANEIDHLSDIDATPVIIDNIVYVVAYNGNLTALDLSSGRIIWNRDLGSVNDFIVNNNRIYLVDQNDRLLALSTVGGMTLWTQNDLMNRFLTAPALYNNILVVGDSAGYIHWVDPETGYFIAQQKVDSSGFLTKPIIADKKLLLQAKNGIIYAITR